MPKASNDELGLDVSGRVSRPIGEIEASTYLSLRGGDGRWSFLELIGWITRPSTAAHMRILRARPDILVILWH